MGCLIKYFALKEWSAKTSTPLKCFGLDEQNRGIQQTSHAVSLGIKTFPN